MTIRANPEGTYEMVLHDDMTGPSSGPSTDSGTGRLDGAGRLVILSITTMCKSGGEPVGAGSHLIFVHDPMTDTITDDFGVVWRRDSTRFHPGHRRLQWRRLLRPGGGDDLREPDHRRRGG